jgi:hypothetical protein
MKYRHRSSGAIVTVWQFTGTLAGAPSWVHPSWHHAPTPENPGNYLVIPQENGGFITAGRGHMIVKEADGLVLPYPPVLFGSLFLPA